MCCDAAGSGYGLRVGRAAVPEESCRRTIRKITDYQPHSHHMSLHCRKPSPPPLRAGSPRRVFVVLRWMVSKLQTPASSTLMEFSSSCIAAMRLMRLVSVASTAGGTCGARAASSNAAACTCAASRGRPWSRVMTAGSPLG